MPEVQGLEPEIQVLEDIEALAESTARRFTALAHAAIAQRGAFTVALAGGATPKSLYARLSEAPYASQVDWQKVHLFWGDERCVPPEHYDSNFRMVQEALLSKITLPAGNIRRMRGELPPGLAADLYEPELRELFSYQELPRLDLLLLGMGEDGHTASLFPGSAALEESVRWVVAVEHTTPPPPLVSRLTLTLPVLNAARQVIFLVAGEGKAARLREVFYPVPGQDPLTVQLIQPREGEVLWMVDGKAARLLK